MAQWVDYYTYIQSDAWQAVKRRYWQSNRPKVCYVCKQPWQTGYHMHHLTYERLGREWLTDIVPVCPPHHKEIHRLQKQYGCTIKQATELARDNFEKKRAAFRSRPCEPPKPKPYKHPWWQERRRRLKLARLLHNAA